MPTMTLPDTLLLAVEYYRDPQRFPQFGGARAPLPPGITELLASYRQSLADEHIEVTAKQLATTPEGLRAAVRFLLRTLLFNDASDYYRILGVAPSAPKDDIKAHYRDLMVWFHPDKDVSGEAWDTDFATLINEAYSALRTPKNRAQYDATLGSDAFGADTPAKPQAAAATGGFDDEEDIRKTSATPTVDPKSSGPRGAVTIVNPSTKAAAPPQRHAGVVAQAGLRRLFGLVGGLGRLILSPKGLLVTAGVVVLATLVLLAAGHNRAPQLVMRDTPKEPSGVPPGAGSSNENSQQTNVATMSRDSAGTEQDIKNNAGASPQTAQGRSGDAAQSTSNRSQALSEDEWLARERALDAKIKNRVALATNAVLGSRKATSSHNTSKSSVKSTAESTPPSTPTNTSQIAAKQAVAPPPSTEVQGISASQSAREVASNELTGPQAAPSGRASDTLPPKVAAGSASANTSAATASPAPAKPVAALSAETTQPLNIDGLGGGADPQAASGPAKTAIASAPAPDIKLQVRAMISAFQLAYSRADAEGIAALFAPKAKTPDGVGPAKVLASYAAFFETVKVEEFQVLNTQWRTRGDRVLVDTTWRITTQDLTNQEYVSVEADVSLVARSQGDVLKIEKMDY
jgi:ketosteroid isomerase-like protein